MKKTLLAGLQVVAFMAASPAQAVQWWGHDVLKAHGVACIVLDTSPAKEYEKLTGMGMTPKLVDRGDIVDIYKTPRSDHPDLQFFRSQEACDQEDERYGVIKDKPEDKKWLDKYR